MSKILKILIYLKFLFTHLIAPCQNINLDMNAYYKFDGDATDYSGNGNNGTIIGTVNSATDRNGNANSALSFDGSGYINIPASPSLNTSQFSISIWIKPINETVQSVAGRSIYNNASDETFQLSINYNYKGPQITIKQNSGCVAGFSWQRLFAKKPTPPNVWSMITATFDGNVMKIYVNCELMAISDPLPNKNIDNCTNGALRFGVWWKNELFYYQGLMDEARLYSRAITQEEVDILYGTSQTINPKQNLSFQCIGDISVPYSNTKNYIWSTGEITNKISVNKSGKYWVKAIEKCSETIDTFVVTITKLPVAVLNAGKDTTFCSPPTSIQFNATQGFISYNWFPSTTLNRNDIYNPIGKPIVSTQYILTATQLNECGILSTFRDTININITNKDTSINISNKVKCQQVNLIAQNFSGNLSWEFGDPTSGIQNTSQSSITSHTYTSSGKYSIKLKTNKLCGNAWDTTFSVNIPDKPLDPFPSNILVCDTSFLLLNARNSPDANYSWDGRAFDLDSTFLIREPGQYKVEVKKNGCTANFLANVLFDNQAGLKDIDSTTCLGDNIKVDYSGFSQVQWSDLYIGKVRDLSPPVSDLIAYVKSAQCPSFKKVVINLDKAIIQTPIIQGDTFFCEGESTLLKDISLGSEVSWTNGVTASSTIVNHSGLVIAKRTEGNCVKMDSVVITVLPKPYIIIEPEYSFCGSELSDFSMVASTNANDLTWYKDHKTVGNTKTITTREIGVYDLIAKDLNGCISIAKTLLNNNCEPKLFIPKAFTPNLDERNDSLQFFYSNLTHFHIRVFSRWGEVVFDSQDVNKGWDGIYNNQPLPSGVYNYRAEYSGGNNSFKELYGEITIVR